MTKGTIRKKRRAVAIFDRILDYTAILAGAGVIYIMVTVLGEIVYRYLWGRGIKWVIEVSEIALLYLTFLGTAWLLKEEGHVKIDLVLSRLNPRRQDLLNFVTSFMCIIVCAILTWYGAIATLNHFQTGVVHRAYIVPIPSYTVLLIIPIGCFLLTIQFIRRTYGYLKSFRDASS